MPTITGEKRSIDPDVTENKVGVRSVAWIGIETACQTLDVEYVTRGHLYL